MLYTTVQLHYGLSNLADLSQKRMVIFHSHIGGDTCSVIFSCFFFFVVFKLLLLYHYIAPTVPAPYTSTLYHHLILCFQSSSYSQRPKQLEY